MNINSLTIKAQEILQAAFSLARERGQQAVEPIHLLSVIIAEDDSLGAFLLGRVGVNLPQLREQVAARLNSMPKVNTNSYINLSAYFPSHIPHLLLLASAYVLLKHATSTHYLNIYFFFNITLKTICVNEMIVILFTKLRLDA